jgi:hypothetical protein
LMKLVFATPQSDRQVESTYIVNDPVPQE